ncbi:hypothetical protein EHV15_05125 [Paenibacillus oralis]|uniref:Uncharacterized protein n=1 Tax=Paenibacillus oralis TaxID=2490856 RepID=A0A3P3TX43_9BACL|nr:hypothetical protein [Paenibacillus oralis]RRJ62400.1 hypothetical protein EHV15_05125 [Paenibacillus oralis]
MFYFFMILWSLASIATIVLFFVWLAAKLSKKPSKTKGKSTLYLLASSILFLVVSLIINGTGDKAVSTIVSNQNEETPMILDANKFSRISPDELIKIMGEPESKEEWKYDSSNGQTYEAITWTYQSGNHEFLFIDGKVVRFTFYGTGEIYKDKNQALSLFGIAPGADIMLEADTGVAFRCRHVDQSSKIAEFWLIEGGEEDSIGTVKITYDLKYF